MVTSVPASFSSFVKSVPLAALFNTETWCRLKGFKLREFWCYQLILSFFILSGQKVGFSEKKLSNVSVITLVFILSGWENFHIGAYIFSFCFSWLINRNVLLINFDHRHQSQAKGIKSVYADFELLFCKQWDKKEVLYIMDFCIFLLVTV